MINQEKSDIWCPHCGFTTSEEKIAQDGKSTIEEPVVEETTELLVKKRPQKWSENKMGEVHCSKGGWWNPITKKCMGEGIGFDVDF